MKQTIIDSFKKLIADKQLTILLSFLLMFSIILSMVIGFSIHSSDVQLIVHYSAFGITHLYRDQWFYLIIFVLFELLIALIHIAISVKMLVIKDRNLAMMTAWLGVAICLIGFVTMITLINVWKPL